MPMQDYVRVDLVFPRSGQVLPVSVPDGMMKVVADRNLRILFTLSSRSVPSIHAEVAQFVQ